MTFSKHPYIADNRAVMADVQTKDDSVNPVCKDYSNSPANRSSPSTLSAIFHFHHPRFSRVPPGSYKHIYRPSAVLFFSNASPNATEDLFHELFASLQALLPILNFLSLHKQSLFSTLQSLNPIAACSWTSPQG